MSALQSPARPPAPRRTTPAPGPTPSARPGGPPLRSVPSPAPSVTPGAGFVLTCVGLLAGSLLTLLGLNVAISANSFTVDSLESRQRVLIETEDALRLAVADAGTPQRLDARARALGMVAVQTPVLLVAPPEVAGGSD